MSAIIQNQPTDIKHFLGHSTSCQTQIPYVTRLQMALLTFFYDLRLQGIEVSNYSLDELSVRFKRSPNHISTALADTEEFGYMGSEHGGSTNKRRWITFEGFSLIDNKHGRQIVNQIIHTPYIDLSDQEKINLKIIKEGENCEQLNPEEQLDLFLEIERTSFNERNRIKKAIRTAPIGPVRRQSVIARVIKAATKNRITNKLAYFLTAIRKEVEDMNDFIRHTKSMKPNYYDQSGLNELGCFA